MKVLQSSLSAQCLFFFFCFIRLREEKKGAFHLFSVPLIYSKLVRSQSGLKIKRQPDKVASTFNSRGAARSEDNVLITLSYEFKDRRCFKVLRFKKKRTARRAAGI